MLIHSNAYETQAYSINEDHMGGFELNRHEDGATLYLQPGDDASSVAELIDALSASVQAGFKTQEQADELIDALLILVTPLI